MYDSFLSSESAPVGGSASAGDASAGGASAGDASAGGAAAAFAGLDDGALEASVIELAGQISAATCRFLDLACEVERRELHFVWGCRSAADWLSVRCGISRRTAFENMRVARAIGQYRLVHDAFSRGELSYCKVRAITRAITDENEETLVEFARYATGAQLDAIVRAFCGAKEAVDPALEAARRDKRFLRYRYEADGSLVGWFRLPPESGATLIAALDEVRAEMDGEERSKTASPESECSGQHREQVEAADPEPERSEPECSAGHCEQAEAADPEPERSEPERSEPERSAGHCEQAEAADPVGLSPADPPGHWRSAEDPYAAREADGLVRIAENSLVRAGEGDLVFPRPLAVLHIEGTGRDDNEITLGGGPHLSGECARRLTCDAMVLTRTEVTPPSETGNGLPSDKVDSLPIDRGRRRRLVTPALRRALEARDKGCRFPGCYRRRFTHAHHTHHWADGGATDLDNLVSLCSYHHHAIHEGGCRLERDENGELVFYNTRGERIADRVVPVSPRPAESGDIGLRLANREAGCHIEPDASVPLGAGEPYDLAMAVDALMWFEPVGVRGY